MTRRELLISFVMLFLFVGTAEHARASDDDHGSGHDSGGDDGGKDDGDNDDHDDDDSGGGNSGPGNGTNSGSGSNSGSGQNSSKIKRGKVVTQAEAKKAIQSGAAASMPLLLNFVQNNYPGELLDIKLRENSGQFIYEVRYLALSVFLRTVFLDAKTLRKL